MFKGKGVKRQERVSSHYYPKQRKAQMKSGDLNEGFNGRNRHLKMLEANEEPRFVPIMKHNPHSYGSVMMPFYDRVRKLHSNMNKEKVYQQFDQNAMSKMMESVISYVAPVRLSPQVVKRNKETHPTDMNPEFYFDDEMKCKKIASTEECCVSPRSSIIGEIEEAEEETKSDESDGKSEIQSASDIEDEEETDIQILIHVYDEARGEAKDFNCGKEILAAYMGYFANIMTVEQIENFDISIHCDLEIFDWLMKWIKYNVKRIRIQSDHGEGDHLNDEPELTIFNVIPIISSANFLGMDSLIEICLDFLHQNLNEIIKIAPNFGCLDDNIVSRLASKFSNVQLNRISDRNELIIPHLWIKFIQNLCEPNADPLRGHYYSICGLFRCSQCKYLINPQIQHHTICRKSNMRLNRWGQYVYQHTPDPKWDINQCITDMFDSLQSWRNVYWKLWSYSHILYCDQCQKYFPINQMSFCQYHPGELQYEESKTKSQKVQFSCCKREYVRFNVYSEPDGCRNCEHSILIKSSLDLNIYKIVKRIDENSIFDAPATLDLKSSSSRIDLPLSKLMPKRNSLLPAGATCSVVRRRKKRTAEKSSSLYIKVQGNSVSTEKCDGRSKNSETLTKNDKINQSKEHCSLGRSWSQTITTRSNQDLQREFEEKLMKEIIDVVDKKIGTHQSSRELDKSKLKGSYFQLEAEWRKEFVNRFGTEDKSSIEQKVTRAEGRSKRSPYQNSSLGK